jgi:pyruvate/2-oxoglutarate dehydrogenase complex dihydrolipoamide dehydrogenase (E3) component
MRIGTVPASIVIVGGGYVAAEFAHIFSGLGVAIHMIDMAPRLIDPQIATVGARVQDLAGHRPYVEATQAYRDTAYGWALRDTTGICTLYADPGTGRLLGAHILGYQASLLIQPLVQAASTGLGVAEMARGQYWIHPALGEVVENALLKLDLAR